MKNQTEKSRWAKIAGLPKTETKKTSTKKQLDENVVGVGAINPIFAERKPTDYEMAFEHYLGEMYDSNKNKVDDVNEGGDGEPYPVGTKFNKPDGNQTITILSYEGSNVKIQATLGGEKEGSGFKHTWPTAALPDIIKSDKMTIIKGEGVEEGEIVKDNDLKENLDDLPETGVDVRDRTGDVRLDLADDSDMVSRIEGLVNARDLGTMKDMLRILTAEWMQDGFEKEDIQDYITDLINKI